MSKPSNSEFSRIFDGIAGQYDKISNPYAVFLRQSTINNWALGRCLEVGAGTGAISEYLSSKHSVVATDISPQMVEEIRKRGIEAHICDAENLPFDNNSFDTIVSAEMLFYLDNPDKFLSEAYRVLKPNGRLLISCANNLPAKFYDKLRAFLRIIGIEKGAYFKEDTLRDFMTSSKLKDLLQKQNFAVIKEIKTPVLPLQALDPVNKLLEKTPLRSLGVFIFTLAEKQ